MDNSKKSALPSLQQIRQSVADFDASLMTIYEPDYGEINTKNTTYIDPILRKQKNLPPWYAVLPYGIYNAFVSEKNAVLDKENKGGIIFSDQDQTFEVVRVDFFAQPTDEAFTDIFHNNKTNIARFSLDAEESIFPGFCVREFPQMGPVGVSLIVDPIDVVAQYADFSCRDDDSQFKTHTEFFRHNMTALKKTLARTHLNVQETAEYVTFKGSGSIINGGVALGQSNQLLFKN